MKNLGQQKWPDNKKKKKDEGKKFGWHPPKREGQNQQIMDIKKQKIENDKLAAPRSGGCFNYGGSHFAQNYPNKDEFIKTNNSHKIHAITNRLALDNQTTLIILKGILLGKIVTVMLDSDATDSFISSYLLHSLPIKAKLLEESWKVEFALG